jgi:hypothetical protein
MQEDIGVGTGVEGRLELVAYNQQVQGLHNHLEYEGEGILPDLHKVMEGTLLDLDKVGEGILQDLDMVEEDNRAYVGVHLRVPHRVPLQVHHQVLVRT